MMKLCRHKKPQESDQRVKSCGCHITIFSDARPGHEIQSLSLAKNLCRLAEQHGMEHSLTCHRFAIRQPWLSFAPRVLPRFSRHILWQSSRPSKTRPVDIIITCGRRAAAVGKWFVRAQRQQGLHPRHIQILNPGDTPTHYDFLLLPDHDLAAQQNKADNIITFTGCLHPVDTHWLEQQRSHWAERLAPLKQESPLLALLLGNPGQSFFTRELPEIRQKLAAWHPGARLLVLASHRTPNKARSVIIRTFPDAVLHWLDTTDGENPYAGVLAWADAFAVTADSINMLSEAFATGKPVLPLAVRRVSPKHRRFAATIQARPASSSTTTWHTACRLWRQLKNNHHK